jgi:hypothetical protein
MYIIVKISSRQAEISSNMALSTFAENMLISENWLVQELLQIDHAFLVGKDLIPVCD